MANFSKLPYFDGYQDVNPDTAFVSESMVSPAFNDSGQLAPGVHLHWALPDALTQSFDITDKETTALQYPAVPNVWLITRYDGDDKTGVSYLIESDYLYPAGEGATSGAVCFPIGYKHAKQGEPPFRYMGRVLEQSRWSLLDEPHEHLSDVVHHPLTALGYGEPTFAAFYPNCHSVFGFKDPRPPAPDISSTYYLVGWYRNPAHDFCNPERALEILARRSIDEEKAKENTRCQSKIGLGYSQCYHWNVPKEDGAAVIDFPEKSLYFARLSLSPEPSEKVAASPSISVAIGNTATEALSAHLAQALPGPSDEMEDRLESLHLLHELDHLKVDIEAKFKEARHARGFHAVPSGTLWQLAPKDVAVANTPDRKREKRDALPLALAHGLNQLNIAQKNYDDHENKTGSLREVIFADWYKYQLCKYPPGDQGRDYPEIDEAQFLIKHHDFKDMKLAEGRKATLSKILYDVKTDVGELLKDVKKGERAFKLESVSAPRFWEPNEPVVLLTGPDAKPMDRHGHKAPIPCGIFEKGTKELREQSAALRQKIDTMLPPASDEKAIQPIGFRTTDGDPWTPLFMEWETELWPLVSQQPAENRQTFSYHQNYVLDQYDMAQNKVDIFPRRTDLPLDTDTAPAVYQGRSILTPQSKPLLEQQIEQYLKANLYPLYQAVNQPQPEGTIDTDAIKQWFRSLDRDERILHRYCHENNLDQASCTNDYWVENRLEITAWYDEHKLARWDEFILDILDVGAHVANDFNALSQSLSGFNAALLARTQTFQLTVDDPLAFPDQKTKGEPGHLLSGYRAFAEEVKAKVGGHNRYAPSPMHRFAPIRSGRMRLSRVRLLDTFGRMADIPAEDLNKVAVSDTLAGPVGKPLPTGEFVLPPRFVQPLRLGLRWLAGEHIQDSAQESETEDIEMNAHPATSPVCGWLVPVPISNAVEVFAANGDALGTLDINGDWQVPKGRKGLPNTDMEATIKNPHLRRVVRWAQRESVESKGIFPRFLSALMKAQENVEPSDWSAHEAMYLMIGRPIAVVRARAKLEMKGLPAQDPGWETYRTALRHGHNPALENAQIADVKIPVRIGEHRQFNDGLLGYWQEETTKNGSPAPALPDRFWSPQADMDEDDDGNEGRIVKTAHADAKQTSEFNLNLSLNDPATTLTMLMDPRGKLHASCGIVPTKSIQIPPDQCLDALKKIEVSIRILGVVSPRELFVKDLDPIHLQAPNIEGYDISWAEQHEKGNWVRTRQLLKPSPDAELTHKNDMRDGYLILRKSPPKEPDTR